MDTFDRADLLRLTSHEGPCVSLFLETHPTGRDGEQDAIRLKNLIREAERLLSGHWQSASEARAMLEPAAELSSDLTFWQHRRDGLAIFTAAGLFETFRVPLAFREQITVAHRFRVRPLLPLIEQHLSFYLLAFSENQVALYSVDEQTIEHIDVPNLPANLVESLNYAGAERGQQTHSATHGMTGKQAAVFHGQGGQADTKKEDQKAYCVEIDKAVCAWIGESTRPLMLACVEQLAAIYRRQNSYDFLLEEVFAGNHDRDSEHHLRESAWRIAQPLLKSQAVEATSLFAERAQKVTADPAEAVSCACQGRVDRLLYNPQAELFGRCSPDGAAVSVTGNQHDDDLVELAVVQTLRKGGEIHSMADQQLPTNSPLAALLRY